MTEADAILGAIRDAPADDAPRLVYADWLEEHGDPDRAAFIRVQCELERPGTAPARRRRLAARARVLLAAHRARWLGRLARSHLPWVFHRGFVERLGSGGFFRHGPDRWRDETWWEHVRFFPDGLLVYDTSDCPTSRYRLRDVARRLRRGNRRLERAAYTLTAGPGRVEVRFTLPGRPAAEEPPVRYKGTIRGTVLSLSGKALPGGWPFRDDYKWVPLPDGR